jgi:hypothetical protein
MANSLADITPVLVANAVQVLRTNSVLPRLVNRDIEQTAVQQGETINVGIAGALTVTDVNPSNVIPAPQNVVFTKVPVDLDQWKKVDFSLTDKEMHEIANGNFPRVAEEAVSKLAKYVDQFLLGMYKEFYGTAGTAGTVPFTNEKPTDAANLRKVLNNQLCPLENRHCVFNADAEASALGVPAFANAEWHGDPQAIIEGKLNMRLGFQWWMDQNVFYHTAGTAATFTVTALEAIGETVIGVTAGTGTFVVGDIVKFANHSQTYTVLAYGGGNLTVRPPLQVAVPATTAITVTASHVANIGFAPQAFAFAVRTLQSPPEALGVMSSTALDDVSGLAIRVQVRYAHFETIWSYDILYGGAVVQPECGARLLG